MRYGALPMSGFVRALPSFGIVRLSLPLIGIVGCIACHSLALLGALPVNGIVLTATCIAGGGH